MSGPINATTQESGRFYTHPGSGEKFWSVSTLCKALAKPALMAWAVKVCAEQAVKDWEYLGTLKPADRVTAIKKEHGLVSGRASAKGTQVHEIIEDWIKAGCPEDYDISQCPRSSDLVKWNDKNFRPITKKELVPYFEGFRAWTHKHQPKFIHSETTVWNRKQQYAGTLDLIAELPHFQLPGHSEPGCFAILDAKSGNGIYPEVGLQLAAYARAEFYLRNGEECELPPVEAGFALHVTPDGTKMIPVNIEDEVFDAFLYIREAYRFTVDIAPRVLGAEVK